MPSSAEHQSFGASVAWLSIFGFVFLVNLVLVVYIFVNRSYPPLRAKNLPLMFVSFLAACAWCSGNIYETSSRLMGGSWFTCVIMHGWVRFSMGAFLLISTFLVRIYNYILIFKQHRKMQGWYLWAAVSVTAVISLCYAIPAVSMPQDVGITFDKISSVCVVQRPLYVISVGLLVLQFCVAVVLAYAARDIKSCYNESAEIVTSIIGGVFTLLFTVAMRWLPGMKDHRFAANMATAISVLVAYQLYFAIILFKPTYHCFFDGAAYLDHFIERLQGSNLLDAYNVEDNRPVPPDSIDPDSHLLPAQLTGSTSGTIEIQFDIETLPDDDRSSISTYKPALLSYYRATI